jgi:nicotinate phosphoribosyltransferase
MVYSAIYRDEDMAAGHLVSQLRLLQDWEDEYGLALSIFLPDTYGSDQFFKLVPPDMIARWKGSRHDSGPDIEYGEKCIRMYGSLEIDAARKLGVFADGQDPWKADKIERHFRDRLGVSFGIGTNFTNDFGLTPNHTFEALAIVVKAVKANGLPLAKLSDNVTKAIGDPAEIKRVKKLAGYDNTYTEAVRY